MNVRRASSGVGLSVAALYAIGMLLCGCAASSINLEPDRLSADDGALIGHVLVRNFGHDVTSSCYIRLTDAQAQSVAYLALDASGWVFTSIPRGHARVSQLVCSIGWLLIYELQGIEMYVPGTVRSRTSVTCASSCGHTDRGWVQCC